LRFQQIGDRYQLRIESGEAVAATLKVFLAAKSIGFAQMTGLGAVSSASIAYLRAERKEYENHTLDEQMEVVSLIGNVALKDGEPFLHIHVTLARSDLSVVGGHFLDATVSPLLEIWLAPEDTTVNRVFDESCGLYLMDLPERA
jgi:predicted DNA-binding protein with PD1-like motif